MSTEPTHPEAAEEQKVPRVGVFDSARLAKRFDDPDYSEADAMSTDGEPDSPPPSSSPARLNISVVQPPKHPRSASSNDSESIAPFTQLFLPSDDEMEDGSYRPRSPDTLASPDLPRARAPRRTLDEKVKKVIELMNEVDPRLSIRQFLSTLFTSDDAKLKLIANVFLSSDAAIEILRIWEKRLPAPQSVALASWAIDKSSEVCAFHASLLTERAPTGPFKSEAAYLRMPAKTGPTVERLQSFSMEKLGDIFDRTMGPLQRILSAVMGKEADGKVVGKKVRTLVTSIVLNLRSQHVNLLQHVLGASAWRLQVPRRLVEVMNQLCIFPSYSSTFRAVVSLGEDGVRLVREAAKSNLSAELMQYDNYNWRRIIHEAAAGRTDIQHDQVSAIWILLNIPPGARASDILNVAKFQLSQGARHLLPSSTSLAQILPSPEDETELLTNCELHIATLLSQHCPALSKLGEHLPGFADTAALPPHRTKQFYLPTLDQEQGTVKGNIAVLNEYFFNIVGIPKERFEDRMVAVLGDRLTTARDRSAQEQRALDRSTSRAERLSSIVLLGGLMHTRLALMDVFNRQFWTGGKGNDDPTDLGILHNLLPHLTRVKHRKIDFYAWLRFLEVVLSSLVLAATSAALNLKSKTVADLMTHLAVTIKTPAQLKELSKRIADMFVSSSISRLEARKIKKLDGETVSGHATLLLQSLMIIRELTHAIKHGHLTRIVRCLKYMYPMFHAGGSYNYAAEVGEFLHNVVHDWPKESVQTLVGGLLVNTTGRSDGFKETDLNGEHYNRRLKQRTKGSNMTPKILSAISPALGWLGELNERLFPELGAEHQNTRHARVKTTEDVRTLTNHLLANQVFDFGHDRKSQRAVSDLYIKGCNLLAHGGHERHLQRHKQATMNRHETGESASSGADAGPARTEQHVALGEQNTDEGLWTEFEINSDWEDEGIDDGQQSEDD
ncbi:hypothetical protein FRC04_008352 [Tulasnella sp. 424]|nr:hypothetical protein FRC04_008352 [Tulasnella sp. 424]KAG8964790.1 hypothetical protein FRC05_003580 [Tulasnella sp. 425]